jgi:hypothetical protein
MLQRRFWTAWSILRPIKFSHNLHPVHRPPRSFIARFASTSPPPEQEGEDRHKLQPGFWLVSVLLLGGGSYGIYAVYKRLDKRYRGKIETAFPPKYERLQNLDNIRVLALAPGQSTDTIHCRLEHVSLSGKPHFEALSYVWGDPTVTGEIHCSGEKVRVGFSLYETLQHLRYPDRERVIWADALCVNQLDAKEMSK